MKKNYLILVFVISAFFSVDKVSAQASDPFVGQITIFAGNFAPRGWAICNGQLMSVNQNQALFAILGTTYGGDGINTFGLPDLRNRVPVGQGNGAGGNKVLGEVGGSSTTTITTINMPPHTHQLMGSTSVGNSSVPTGSLHADTSVLDKEYTNTATNLVPMNYQAIGVTGSGQPFNNEQPYLGVNYIISLYGVFPSRDN